MRWEAGKKELRAAQKRERGPGIPEREVDDSVPSRCQGRS